VATLRDALHRDKTGAVKFIDRSGEIKGVRLFWSDNPGVRSERVARVLLSGLAHVGSTTTEQPCDRILLVIHEQRGAR
jgi:hypothetical protein